MRANSDVIEVFNKALIIYMLSIIVDSQSLYKKTYKFIFIFTYLDLHERGYERRVYK